MSSRDDDFEALMATMGVKKIDEKGRRKATPPRAPAGPPPKKMGTPTHRPAPRPAPRQEAPQFSEDPQLRLARLERESVAHAAELARRAQEVEGLRAQLAQAAARVEALATAREAAQGALAAAQEAASAAAVERDQLDAERRSLQRQLEEARSAPPTAVPAGQLLTARGLDEPARRAAALAGLAERFPAELEQALVLADPVPLAQLLDQRVTLVGPDGEPGDDVVAVRVKASRCELGSASDIAAAWDRFHRTCGEVRVVRVTIVGGSPNYRRQLKDLAQGGAVELNLISGTTRRPRHRAEADVRNSDLVIIWAATELDHSVSAPYSASSGGKVLTIGHRGISGMLDRVRQEIGRWAHL